MITTMHDACRALESTMSGVKVHDEVAASPLDRVIEPAPDLASGRLIDLTLSGFADQVGEPFPRAGGGSVAAYAGSMAAALVGMVCRLTVASKGVEADEAELRPACVAAETLRARLLAAVDADTDAYLEVAASYRLPKDTAGENVARDAAVAAARRRAADVPLAAAAACLEVLELASGLSAGFNTAAASELAVAVQAAMTCVRGGAVDVAINLKYLDEDSGVKEMRRRTAEIEGRADEAFAAAWPLLRDLSAGTAG
jgi:formiminotetrahydrofolate cyclodeaminase